MDAFEELFQAIMSQQMQPSRVVVDEMGVSQSQQDDQMRQVLAMGQEPFFTGLSAMNEVEKALSGGKKKNEDYVPFGF